MGASALPALLTSARDPASAGSEVGAQAVARREFRRQIARLEGELAAAFLTAHESGGVCFSAGARAAGPPRLLDLAELEAVRDDLAERLRDARLALSRRAQEQARARLLLEQMLRDPARHRFARVTCLQLGEPGCGAWEARPRMGLIGMAMGWWQVKLSSGCPLAAGGGRDEPRRETSHARA